MFSALFLGIIFSSFGLFQTTIQDETFNVLSTMGMLFLLFMIGFNLEIGQMKRFGKQILKGAILIVTLEATIVGTILFFLFPTQVGNSPLVAIVVALSFVTVARAVIRNKLNPPQGNIDQAIIELPAVPEMEKC
jgi:Kef-type K+ transport system membrane component KefB